MPVNPKATVLFRYEDAQPSHQQMKLTLHTYKILSTTPQGYWIEFYDWRTTCQNKKWVHADGARSFAFDTEEAALRSFICRKRHHRQHILRRFKQADYSYKLACNMQAKDKLGDKLVYDVDEALDMEMSDLEELANKRHLVWE